MRWLANLVSRKVQVYDSAELIQTWDNRDDSSVRDIAVSKLKLLKMLHLTQILCEMRAPLHTELILWKINDFQSGHVSLETVDDHDWVFRPNAVIYELHVRYLKAVSLYRLSDSLHWRRGVKELVWILNSRAFLLADDLASAWVDVHFFALLKVCEPGVCDLFGFLLVFEFPLTLVEFPKFEAAFFADQQVLIIKFLFLRVRVFEVNHVCALKQPRIYPLDPFHKVALQLVLKKLYFFGTVASERPKLWARHKRHKVFVDIQLLAFQI